MHHGATTSHRYCDGSTGYQYDDVSTSRLPSWFSGQAPGYLAEDCQLVADVSVRRLRSADTATCVTRRTSNIFGDRCFAAAGLRMELTANKSKTMSKSGTIQALIKDIFCLMREATAPCDILLKVRRI